MKLFSNYYIVLLFGLFILASCNKDEPVIEEPVELITTLIYTLTPTDGGSPVEFRFTDIDGDGGDAPTITTENLASNTTYTGSISLLNESESPAEDIAEEVAEEDDEHQMFFAVSGADLTVSYNDTDGDGNPLGLATSLVTQAAGSGTLTITLRHEPNKDGVGVSEGDITNAGGETDIEVAFPVTIE